MPDTLQRRHSLARTIAKAIKAALGAGPALLVSDREAAQLLGIGRTTFLRLVSAGDLPASMKVSELSRRRVWRRADLEAHVLRLTPSRRPHE